MDQNNKAIFLASPKTVIYLSCYANSGADLENLALKTDSNGQKK